MSSVLARAVAAATREAELRLAAEAEHAIELTEAEKYARDPLAWLDSGHVWIASPFGDVVTQEDIVAVATGKRRKLRPVRLQLFPDQIETLKAWIDLDTLERTGELFFRNVVIEKTRQIGETWAFAGAICWALHYHTVTGLAMHTKGGKIDDGGERNTLESLFGRVRYIERRLDPAKLPGCGDRLLFRPFSRDPAKIENLASGALWLGEGQTDNPGRGSTFDALLADEAAFIEHGEQVYAALDEACPEGKALLSTVNGDGNFHARIAKERPKGYTYLRLHWSRHPIYSRGMHVAGAEADCALCEGNRSKVRWDPSDPRSHRYVGKSTSWYYDARVIGKTDVQVANELDIDRERAKAGRVYPEFSTSAHVVTGGLPYLPEHFDRLELALDPGLDLTSVLVFQDMPTELRMIGILEAGHLVGTSGVAANVADALRDYLRSLGVSERGLTFEFTRAIFGVSDPAAHNRETSSGKSYVQELRRKGFYFGKPPTRLTRTISPSVSALKLLFEGHPKPLRICGINAAAFAEHARENTWRLAPDGRVLGLLDDSHNHAMRAAAYYAVAKFPPPGEDLPIHGDVYVDDDEMIPAGGLDFEMSA